MRQWRVNDLLFGTFGDLSIGPNGDLEDTESIHELVSFIQEVKNRITSELYDWAMHPHIGAGLADLQGEPNSVETAKEGEIKIIAALTKDGFIQSSLIKIRYTPVNTSTIFFNVIISLPDLSEDESINLSLLLDYDELRVNFI